MKFRLRLLGCAVKYCDWLTALLAVQHYTQVLTVGCEALISPVHELQTKNQVES